MARVRNQRGAGERLRGELLAAAGDILDRTGDPAQVTVRGVAGAVGVAPNAVYLHFADRDSLLGEIAIERFEALTAAINEAVGGIDDPLEALHAGNETYCRMALERPGRYRLMFRGMVHPPPPIAERMREAGQAAFQTCIDCCTALVESRGAADVDPLELAGAVWAFEHGWCEIAMAGMAPRGGQPSPRHSLSVLLGPHGQGALAG